ncbi:MAG: aldehyde dehydrogenase family protein, partial [Phycisphaerales bacterium]|nr:aldehyde dehydrogenase family protein [Phycisphaerales bacterium]
MLKTYKLYVNGAFPRSESGRSLPVTSPEGRVLAHICHASRKDLRDAVGAAHKAAAVWRKATAYNRGQILYRLGEMLEGKGEEFAGAIKAVSGVPIRTARREVEAAVDRLVGYAGWADKYAQVLGCNNPVAGPYYNFTVPEGTGTVAVVCPDEPYLLGLVSLLAPVMCGGSASVVVAGEKAALVASLFGEVCATSDVPAGVVN